MILFIAILASLLIGYLAGAFVMALRLIRDMVLEQLTGNTSKRLKTLKDAVSSAVADTRGNRAA